MIKDQNEYGGIQWRCKACDYATTRKSVLYEHVESKHVQSSGYGCHVCEKFCPSLNALRTHVSRYHKK